MTPETAGLTIAIALAAGVVAQSLARQLRLPGIVLLLATGAALGPEGTGWIEPRSLGEGLFDIVDFAIAIILFEGGLNLEWSRLRRQEAAIRRLITAGATCTLVGAALVASLALGWRWDLALLFGSLVVVTGPTVVAPLLRDMRLHPRLKTILEAEGVLIDPIGALLAAFVLQVVAAPVVGTVAAEVFAVAASIGFGLVAGGVAGLVLIGALRYPIVVARDYENIFALAWVVLVFYACDAVVSHSGLMAVTVAGVVVGNVETRVGRELREFKDRLTVMLVGLLFVLLAADVSLEEVLGLGRGGVIVVATLVLVIRPAGVWVATRGLTLSARERGFIGWIAPRGIVAAALGTITAVTLEGRVDGGEALRALVFLTIATTVVLAGLTARPLAWLLGLLLPGRDRVAILGARGLALALATELRAADVPVVFLETDPKRSRVAEEAGFPVVFGDPLEERTMLRAQAPLVGTAIGLTFNEHFNNLFVRRALELFEVPTGYVAMDSLFGEGPAGHMPRGQADMLFDGPHDGERWDVRWRHGEVTVEHFACRPAPATAERRSARQTECCVMLTRRRGKTVRPMRMGDAARPGDVAAVAIYTPEREQALSQLAALGWHPMDRPGEDAPPKPS